MEKIHFVGIKGSGVSALAQILADLEYPVQGSDVDKTYFTQIPLEQKGVPIFSFNEENINENMVVIASNAFNDQHEEVKKAKEVGASFYRYHSYLGEFIAGFNSVAVTGAHGKTSTTGLLSHVLGCLTPTSFLIGDGTGKGKKGSNHFVFEACEYRRHFLSYKPDYAIVTNIDFDHPDYFQNEQDVFSAFQTFAAGVKKGMVVCGEDRLAAQLETPSHIHLIRYGFSSQNELVAKNVMVENGKTVFDVYYQGEWIQQLRINGFGDHQVLNALAVIGILLLQGMDVKTAAPHFLTFSGVKRRFKEKQIGSNIVIDDYAHHPTEIKATIQSARMKYPEKQVVAVFQPHTYTRTRQFLKEFAEELGKADAVYLNDIFGSAREEKGNLSVHDLIKETRNAHYVAKENIEVLRSYENSVIMFMGAGDIGLLQEEYEKNMASCL